MKRGTAVWRVPAKATTQFDGRLHTVCAVCHAAITEGRLKVKGRAPDGLTWEGPFGVIERPLPLPSSKRPSAEKPLPISPTSPAASAGMLSRDGREPYGVPAAPDFGSRDPAYSGSRDRASGEVWSIQRVPDWAALDPKQPLGSIESGCVAAIRGGP